MGPFRTSWRCDWVQFLLFSRETLVVGPLASAKVELGSDNDVTAAEFEFLDDATAVDPGSSKTPKIDIDDRLIVSDITWEEGAYSSNSAPPPP